MFNSNNQPPASFSNAIFSIFQTGQIQLTNGMTAPIQLHDPNKPYRHILFNLLGQENIRKDLVSFIYKVYKVVTRFEKGSRPDALVEVVPGAIDMYVSNMIMEAWDKNKDLSSAYSGYLGHFQEGSVKYGQFIAAYNQHTLSNNNIYQAALNTHGGVQQNGFRQAQLVNTSASSYATVLEETGGSDWDLLPNAEPDPIVPNNNPFDQNNPYYAIQKEKEMKQKELNTIKYSYNYSRKDWIEMRKNAARPPEQPFDIIVDVKKVYKWEEIIKGVLYQRFKNIKEDHMTDYSDYQKLIVGSDLPSTDVTGKFKEIEDKISFELTAIEKIIEEEKITNGFGEVQVITIEGLSSDFDGVSPKMLAISSLCEEEEKRGISLSNSPFTYQYRKLIPYVAGSVLEKDQILGVIEALKYSTKTPTTWNALRDAVDDGLLPPKFWHLLNKEVTSLYNKWLSGEVMTDIQVSNFYSSSLKVLDIIKEETPNKYSDLENGANSMLSLSKAIKIVLDDWDADSAAYIESFKLPKERTILLHKNTAVLDVPYSIDNFNIFDIIDLTESTDPIIISRDSATKLFECISLLVDDINKSKNYIHEAYVHLADENKFKILSNVNSWNKDTGFIIVKPFN